MKVGIMTLFDNLNYGATLQAYALQTVIRRMGFECEDIDYVREVNNPIAPSVDRVAVIKRKTSQLLHYRTYKAEKTGVEVRRKAFKRFIREKMQVSEKHYNGHADIPAAADKYDIFVCGSDNIWNKSLLDTAFFLDFVPDEKKKIAYAPGMSTDTISEEQKDIIEPLALRFSSLSVREKSGRDLIARITGRDVFQALDPTLLISGTEWREKEEIVDLPIKKYVFCYFFGTNPVGRNCAKKYAQEKGLPIVTLPMHGRYEKEDVGFGEYRLYDITPAQFIWLIDHAECIFTDSFHGTTFSVLLEKSFFCFRRFFEEQTKSLNLRIDSLLQTIWIDGRIIETEEQLKDIKMDYCNVTPILERKRQESLNYLGKALED